MTRYAPRAMPWFFEVVESTHEIQNPTSPEKIRLLGKYLQLGYESRVLDIASGRGGPAIVLARSFGCHITCVERAEEFHVAARDRVREAGLDRLVELVHADALEFPIEKERYDAALCLGASFVWGGLRGTLEVLAPGVRGEGFVAVGEPYWRKRPLPEGIETDSGTAFVTLSETVGRFETAGLQPVAVIEASLDDWDRYESLHWLNADEWLHQHPDDPDAEEIRSLSRRYRERYFSWERDLLGWAVIVGRKS